MEHGSELSWTFWPAVERGSNFFRFALPKLVFQPFTDRDAKGPCWSAWRSRYGFPFWVCISGRGGMGLAAEVAAYRDGMADPTRLVGEFRRAVLLLPLADGEAGSLGGLMSAVSGGVRWLYAFTDEEALSRFTQARREADREWRCLAIPGARLVDEVIPAVGGWPGVAVNVADENGSMLFPPLAARGALDARGVKVEHGNSAGRKEGPDGW
ncbi:SseB family protein [Streptomyces virginiae]|uniref:SseB family protein n=1 Tax=Streptomyces virginiae TaxID=1961 RepID=UPI0036FD81EA